MKKHPRLIAVVGQTASGKTSLAIDIAKKYNGEIICADSRTIYRDLDIGTAKPTRGEQEAVPHHLIDIASPGDNFSAALFKELAIKKIDEIAARGNLPILAGGTGLYIDSVIYDYKFSKIDPTNEERRKLEALPVEDIQLLLRSKNISFPENEKNKRYLVRSLERGTAFPEDRKTLRPNTLVVGLEISKNQLRKRVEERVEIMFKRGLRREVQYLVDKYGWSSEALTGIGYREFKPYFDGKASVTSVKQKIIQNTIHFAKRQKTWFKRNRSIIWCTSKEEAIQKVDAFLDLTDYN